MAKYLSVGLLATLCLVVVLEGVTCEYKIIVDKVYEEMESDVIQVDISFEEEDGGYIFNSEARQLIDLDNDYKIRIEYYAAETADDEFIKVITLPERDMCDVLSSYFKIYFYGSLNNDLPVPEMCPIPANTWSIKNVPVNISGLKKYVTTGYYRIAQILLKDDVVKAKLVLDLHVEE